MEYWSDGELEHCAFSELHLARARLGVLSGRLNCLPNPGQKPCKPDVCIEADCGRGHPHGAARNRRELLPTNQQHQGRAEFFAPPGATVKFNPRFRAV